MIRMARNPSRAFAALAAVAMGLQFVSSTASAQVIRRSIDEFVAAQGTYCIDDGEGGCFLFVPPVENFLGWFDPRGLGISVDYAGLADDYLEGDLGTSFEGTVTERPLRGGGCLVRVMLHTRDALTWVIPWDPEDENPFGDNDLLFGARVTDIEDGAEPALGDSLLILEYIAPECGLPLLDLIELAFFTPEGYELRSVKFIASADGLLADGTPGRVHVTQVGLFHTGFHGAVADGFPVERITLAPGGP